MKKTIFFFVLLFTNIWGTSLDQCLHLINRTSLGITGNELSLCLQDQNYHSTLSRVLSSTKKTLEAVPHFTKHIIKPPRKIKLLTIDERRVFAKKRNRLKKEMKVWWMEQLISTENPFEAKMILFWQNHFTTSLQKVGQPTLMYRQNQLFRKHALGNYRDFLHAIIENPTMLIYLDNRANRKKHPNENFARELLELFTLGEGNYSENDIKELARALTGYSLDKKMHFRFKKKIHDKGVKTFLGQKGRYDAHDLVDIILKQPAAATFIVTKLWKNFISYKLAPKEIEKLTVLFRKNHYELKPLIEAMFTSPYFTDPSSRGKMIKSPIELVVGTLRTFEYRDFDPTIAMRYAKRLGQDPLNPPNVKGWVGEESWINASTLLTRQEFIYRLTRAKEKGHMNYENFKNKLIAPTPEEAAAKILLPIDVYITPAKHFDATLQTILLHPLYQLK